MPLPQRSRASPGFVEDSQDCRLTVIWEMKRKRLAPGPTFMWGSIHTRCTCTEQPAQLTGLPCWCHQRPLNNPPSHDPWKCPSAQGSEQWSSTDHRDSFRTHPTDTANSMCRGVPIAWHTCIEARVRTVTHLTLERHNGVSFPCLFKEQKSYLSKLCFFYLK